MFKSLKGLFSSQNKDLRKRIYFTLLILAVYAFGSNIVVPGANDKIQGLAFLDLLSLMSGGSLKTFSIFSLGVMPYITASILTQILQMDIVPYFKELKEQGATGRQKINKINRYLGILFAFVQGYIYAIAIMKLDSTIEVIKTTIIFTAGTSLLLWLADEITKKGLGNGVSLFIMVGILGNLPATFISAYEELIVNGSFKQALGIALFVLFILAYLLILIGVVFTEISERRIPIQHSTRTANTNVNDQSYLPLKLNSASVMPVIFASALTSIPGLIGQFIDKGEGAFSTFVNNYIIYTSGTGLILYILLIIGFSFLYTLMQLNPKEMAENLDKSRAYVPGITPGERTEMYFKGTLIRLTVTGSISLAILASIPVVLSKLTGLTSAASLGGTGLLIVVGVALETFKQLESSAVSRSYTTAGKRRRG